MKLTGVDLEITSSLDYSDLLLEKGVDWDVFLHYDQRNVGAMAIKPKPARSDGGVSGIAPDAELELLVQKYKEIIMNLWYPCKILTSSLGGTVDASVVGGVLLMPAYNLPRYSERAWCGIVFYGQSVPLNMKRLALFKEGIRKGIRAHNFKGA